MSRQNDQIAAQIVNAWGMNDANDPHAGDALRGRIQAALDTKDAAGQRVKDAMLAKVRDIQSRFKQHPVDVAIFLNEIELSDEILAALEQIEVK